jgi:hypothetical protein
MCPYGLVILAKVAFQACSFNHSDISPREWNQQFSYMLVIALAFSSLERSIQRRTSKR